MLIHDRTANHQLCWQVPVHVQLPDSAETEVTNPLIALDILKNHWEKLECDEAYDEAMAACLAAIKGEGSVENARAAFVKATGLIRSKPA